MATKKITEAVDTTAADDLKDAYNLASEAAGNTLKAIKATAKTQLNTNMEKVNEASEKTESLIRKHPFASVACGFAAGILLAKLLK